MQNAKKKKVFRSFLGCWIQVNLDLITLNLKLTMDWSTFNRIYIWIYDWRECAVKIWVNSFLWWAAFGLIADDWIEGGPKQKRAKKYTRFRVDKFYRKYGIKEKNKEITRFQSHDYSVNFLIYLKYLVL